MKNILKNKNFKAVLSIILLLCLITTSFCCIISGLLRFVVCNKQFYVSSIISDSYIDEIYKYSLEDLKIQCRLYNFDFDTIEHCVTKELIRKYSETHVERVFETLIVGGEDTFVNVESDIFLPSIEAESNRLDENSDFKDSNNREALAGILAKKLSENVSAFANQTIIIKLHKLLFTNKLILQLKNLFFPLFALTVVFITLIVLFASGKPEMKLYLVSLSLWTSSLICFVPVSMIYQKNIPENIILANGPFKTFFASFWNSTVNTLHTVCLALFVLFSIVLLYSVFHKVFKDNKNSSQTKAE